MGAIDESTLENLNLIVHLSKHIQFKNNGEYDEELIKSDFP